MQTVTSLNGFNPAARFHLAGGRDYMMRSEKRGGMAPQHRSPGSGGRPPRRRRRRAGFFYKLLTTILLLILWPVGLVLLWQRRLRWGTGTKLMTSVVTLAACVVLIGFALTVNTSSARYTAVQDSVNTFLDGAADSIIEACDAAGARAAMAYDSASQFARALWSSGSPRLADGIDWGVAHAEKLKAYAHELFAPKEADGTEAPSETEAAPTPRSGDAQSPAPEETAEAAATNPPAAELHVSAQDDALPVYIPDAAPDFSGGRAISSGVLSRSGALDTAAPTPEPTPSPTPEPRIFSLKPAAEAVIYFNESGKYYHMSTVCGSMKTATAHSLGEVRDRSQISCNVCGSPDKALLDETYVAWIDAGDTAHLSNDCPDFDGDWRLISAAEANEAACAGCATCGADRYLAALAAGEEVLLSDDAGADAAAEPADEPTEESTDAPDARPTASPSPTMEPTAEPTPSPTMEPTPSPTVEPTASPTAEPALTVPEVALKPAGEATVYHSSNGKLYHTHNRCSGMTGGDAYTLAECIENYRCCSTCGAPEPELVGQPCLWMDADGLCHTSDACDAFNGQYTLILREEALAQGLTGCTECGADAYLIPGTAIDYDHIPPAASPEASPAA